MEKAGKKFKLALITTTKHSGLGKFAERKLTDFFDFEIIESKEQAIALPSPTPYDACFAMSMGTTMSFDECAIILEELIPKSPKLKWVHSVSAGIEYLLTEKLKKAKHITFTNARGAYNRPLAEFVLLSIIYFAKKIPFFMKCKAEHKYEKLMNDLAYGAEVGIIGYGSIGRSVSKLLKDALNAKIHAISNDAASAEEIKTLASFGSPKDIPVMLPKVDYVVIILPLTPQTKHTIKMEHFKMMKPNAVFINIGRGATVAESDLIEALKTKTISGAALDVFEVEPLPATSPLWDFDNVLLTPHSADIISGMFDLALDSYEIEVKNFMNGTPFTNVVNLERGY